MRRRQWAALFTVCVTAACVSAGCYGLVWFAFRNSETRNLVVGLVLCVLLGLFTYQFAKLVYLTCLAGPGIRLYALRTRLIKGQSAAVRIAGRIARSYEQLARFQSVASSGAPGRTESSRPQGTFWKAIEHSLREQEHLSTLSLHLLDGLAGLRSLFGIPSPWLDRDGLAGVATVACDRMVTSLKEVVFTESTCDIEEAQEARFRGNTVAAMRSLLGMTGSGLRRDALEKVITLAAASFASVRPEVNPRELDKVIFPDLGSGIGMGYGLKELSDDLRYVFPEAPSSDGDHASLDLGGVVSRVRDIRYGKLPGLVRDDVTQFDARALGVFLVLAHIVSILDRGPLLVKHGRVRDPDWVADGLLRISRSASTVTTDAGVRAFLKESGGLLVRAYRWTGTAGHLPWSHLAGLKCEDMFEPVLTPCRRRLCSLRRRTLCAPRRSGQRSPDIRGVGVAPSLSQLCLMRSVDVTSAYHWPRQESRRWPRRFAPFDSARLLGGGKEAIHSSADHLAAIARFHLSVKRSLEEDYDRILAICRNGVILATVLSIIENKPLALLEVSPSITIRPLPVFTHGRSLVFDDTVHSGYTLGVAIRALEDDYPWLGETVEYLVASRWQHPRLDGQKEVLSKHRVRRLFDFVVDARSSAVHVTPGEGLADHHHFAEDEIAEGRLRLASGLLAAFNGTPNPGFLRDALLRECCSRNALNPWAFLSRPELLTALTAYLYRHNADFLDDASAIVAGSRYGMPVAVALSLMALARRASGEPNVRPKHLVYARGSGGFLEVGSLASPAWRDGRVVFVDAIIDHGEVLTRCADAIGNGSALSPERFLPLSVFRIQPGQGGGRHQPPLCDADDKTSIVRLGRDEL